MQRSSRIDTIQVIAFDGSVAVTNAFGSQTRQIRLSCNAHCHYHVYSASDSVTAAVASDPFLPQFWVEYVTVNPGQKISAIKAATNGNVTATAGTLTVTEMT